MIHDIAHALVPAFFTMILGYVIGGRHVIDNRHTASLERLVMRVALPISLFTTLASAPRDELVRHWSLAVVLAAVMVATYAAVYAGQRLLRHSTAPDAALQALTVSFPNLAAIGLPLGVALGPGASLAVAIAIAVGALTVSPLSLVTIERGLDTGHRPSTALALRHALLQPIVLGPLLGLAWSFLAAPLPGLVQVTLASVGGIAGGVALFLTGLVLSALPLRVDPDVLGSALVANVVQPALAWLVVLVAAVPQPFARDAILLLSVPCGFFGILLGLGRGLGVRTAGSTLVVSSLVSVVSLSAAVALFGA